MRRSSRANSFSLFAFQDIITGLCGIMIFMVLVQVVGLAFGRSSVTQSYDFDEEAFEADRERLLAEIAKLNKKLTEVKIKSERAIVSAKDKADNKDVEKTKKVLTEKELVIAALVSQVHDLETKVEAARKADAEDKAKVREMERTRRLLEQQVAAMKGRRGVTLIPERGESKIPVYMVCASYGMEIYSPFEKRPKKRIRAFDMDRELGGFLAELDHTTHCAVLLVRPSGVNIMDRAVELLQANRFSYGRDPLEETEEIVFDVGGKK